MSYTSFYSINPGTQDDKEEVLHLQNSHGSGPVIWGSICVKYLNLDWTMWLFCNRQVFEAGREGKLPSSVQNVLLMTADGAYVNKQDFALAAKDIRDALGHLQIPESYVNHWPEIAEFFESSPDIPAVGIAMASVGDSIYYHDEIDWEKAFNVYLSEQDSSS